MIKPTSSYLLISFFLGVFTTSAIKLLIESFSSLDFSLTHFGYVSFITFFIYVFLLSRSDEEIFKITILKVLLFATFLTISFFFLKSLFEKAYEVSGSNSISFFFVLIVFCLYVIYLIVKYR